MDDAGLGLPNRLRHDAAMALMGFQLATACSQAGMPAVGTKALDRNTSGK